MRGRERWDNLLQAGVLSTKAEARRETLLQKWGGRTDSWRAVLWLVHEPWYMCTHYINSNYIKEIILHIYIYIYERGEITANATDMKDHEKLLGRRVKWHPALKYWISFLTHSDPRQLWNNSIYRLLCLCNINICSQQPREVGPVTAITKRGDVNFSESHILSKAEMKFLPTALWS